MALSSRVSPIPNMLPLGFYAIWQFRPRTPEAIGA